MVFRPELSWEFLSKDEILSLSIKAVRNHVKYLKKASPYYKQILLDINPSDINQIEDITRLPFTSRVSLADNLKGFHAISHKQTVETVLTSGSTGHQLAFLMSEGDLDRLAFSEALSFASAGVTEEDRAQIIVSLDHLSYFALAYYRGLVTLGVNTFRVGIANPELYQKYIQLFRPSVLIGVPSYLNKIGLKLAEKGFDTRSSSINKIFCTGESLRDENFEMTTIGKNLQNIFNANAYSTYGTTELSVAYCECLERHGSHSHPELVFTEIVDESGRPVPDGTPGELVGTPLGIEGIPLLRYRTGDITFKIPGSCSCGRNSDRIGPILGRKSQMIKYKGKTIYPRVITSALDELDFVDDYIIMLEGNDAPSAQVSLHIASRPAQLENINTHLKKRANVTIPILISNVTTINSFRGTGNKKIKVIDKRKRVEQTVS